MKNIIYLFATLILISPLQSQVWEEMPKPFDYEPVYNLTSFNNEVYVSIFNRKIGKNGNYVNLIYDSNEWVRAENDTIYEIFGKPNIIKQFNNKILVSCINGLFLSNDSALNWKEISVPLNSSSIVKDIDISENGVFAISSAFLSPFVKFDEHSDEWLQIDDTKKDTTLPLYIQEIESNSSHIFALQQQIINPLKLNDTLEGGLYISSDVGKSFEKVLVDSALYSIYATDDLLLVCTKHGNLIRSEDNGKTWSVQDIGTVILNYFEDDNRLIASSNPLGILESIDRGKTWKSLNKVIPISSIYKKDSKYFFKGFLNLVYESDDNFKTIKKTNLKNFNTTIFEIYSIGDTVLSTGSFKRGVQYSTDAGENWETYFPELEERGEYVNFIRKKDNQLYCSVPYALYSSLNSGKTFEYNIIGGHNDLIILDDRILINSNNGTSYSKDYGKTIIITDTTVLKRNYKIFKLVQTENKDILAFTQYNGVFKSSDNAETWTNIVGQLPTDTSFASVSDFYEFEGNYFAINITPPLILKSTDNGITWGKLDIPFFREIGNFDLLMIDENNILLSSFNGKENGFRLTTNQGKTWANIDNGLPPMSDDSNYYNILGVAAENIFIELRNNIIGKGESSFYRISLKNLGITTSVESEIERNYLYTFPPYPLPAKSEVKVLFYWDINLPMTVEDISIYDLSGRKIQTSGNLRLEKQASHKGNIIWDCSSTQPGIYLINIKYGTEEKSVKVVVE